MAAILKFWVIVMSHCKPDVRIRILIVNLSRKVSQNIMVLGALVKKLIFQDGG